MESSNFYTKQTDRFKGIDLLNMAIAIVDTNFHVLHFNSAFRKMLMQDHPGGRMIQLSDLFEQFNGKLEKYQATGLQSGHLFNFEFAALKSLHSNRFFDLSFSILPQDEEPLDGFSVAVTDVTERIQEMSEIKELADHHLKFINHTTSGIIIHRDGLLVYVNEQGKRMIRMQQGKSPIGRSVLDFVTKEFREIVVERIQRMNRENTPVEPIEEHIIRDDKTTFPAEIFAYPVIYQGLPAIKVIINDISIRKEAEERLKKSERKHQELINNLQDVVFQTDNTAHLIFINKAWEQLTGFSVKDALGKPVTDFIYDPSGGTNMLSRVKRLLSLGVSTQERDLVVRTAREGDKFIQAKFSAVYNDNGQITGISGLVIDIHSRKTAQLELERIESNLRKHQKIYLSLAKSQVTSGEDFVAALKLIAKTSAETLDLDRVNVWQFNDTADSLRCVVNYDNQEKEYSDEGLIFENFDRYINTIREERIVNVDNAVSDYRVSDFLDSYILPFGVQSMMDAGIFIGDKLWGVICFDQISRRKHWSLEDRAFAANLADMISIIIESGEKRRTQSALEKSEKLTSSILQNASDGIIVIESDSRIVEANIMASTIGGYSRDELIGMHVKQFIPQRFMKQGEKQIQLLEVGKTYQKYRTIVTKDATELDIEISASRLEDGRVLAIIRDVTERLAQEKALRESEARLDMALKGADLGTWDFYIKENKIIHNRRWAEMLGYNFEITTVNEQFWEKFVHPSDIDLAYKAFQDHINGHTSFYEANLRMLASSGEWRWIQDKGRVVEWNELGEPIRASGIHQDITALRSFEKEIEEQRLFLHQVINAIPYPLYVRNVNDEFVVINAAFAEFLGVDRQSVLQYKFNKKFNFNEGQKRLLEPDHEVLLTHDSMLIQEHSLVNASNGKEYWLQTIKVPLRDAEGNYQEVLSVSTEITNVKGRELQLKEELAMLEERLAERTIMLENLNKEVETFNYSVSHDLRTPLRTIDIFAYFLEKKYADQLDVEGKENIQQIRNSITKMSTLIDNLLIFIRMGKAPIQKQNLQPADVIREVVMELSRTMDTSKVKFELGNLPEVFADRPMLRQALVNLISNAIKFSGTRSEPVVSFEGRITDDYSIICIRDNGVGFSMEYKDKLFKAFKRLHSEEHFEGTGVGLAIVEKIIKRLDGEIWAESVLDNYTSFFIKLPLK
jgi:PAS domain S-box-containing protein